MRANEFVNEAFHSKIITSHQGRWTVHIDSHALVSLPTRGIPLIEFTNIISHACGYADSELEKIPRGTGAFIQDTRTKISIYVRKSNSFPLDLTVETVLSPTMTPKTPLISITTSYQGHDTPDVVKSHKNIKSRVDASGRDAVAQELDRTTQAVKNMNREQRRALKKTLRSKK